MDPAKFYPQSLLDQSFGLCISPQDLIYPYYNYPNINYYRPWKWQIQKPRDFGSTVLNEKDKFEICLDVQHFTANEINVKVSGNEVIIEGNHEERRDNDGFISRTFKRRYLLPKDCSADSVVSSLSSDGVLIITANKNKEQSCKEIIVPIKLSLTHKDKELNKTEANTSVKLDQSTEKTNKLAAESKTGSTEADKRMTAIMLKEDHCRLLKPELLGEAAALPATEKCLLQSKRNVANEFSENAEKISKSVNEKSEKDTVIEQKTKEKCDLINKKAANTISEKIDCTASGSATVLESYNVKNMLSETISVEQSSSTHTSSTSSSIKETSEKISEIVSDISAQLKEAAENI